VFSRRGLLGDHSLAALLGVFSGKPDRLPRLSTPLKPSAPNAHSPRRLFGLHPPTQGPLVPTADGHLGRCLL